MDFSSAISAFEMITSERCRALSIDTQLSDLSPLWTVDRNGSHHQPTVDHLTEVFLSVGNRNHLNYASLLLLGYLCYEYPRKIYKKKGN